MNVNSPTATISAPAQTAQSSSVWKSILTAFIGTAVAGAGGLAWWKGFGTSGLAQIVQAVLFAGGGAAAVSGVCSAFGLTGNGDYNAPVSVPITAPGITSPPVEPTELFEGLPGEDPLGPLGPDASRRALENTSASPPRDENLQEFLDTAKRVKITRNNILDGCNAIAWLVKYSKTPNCTQAVIKAIQALQEKLKSPINELISTAMRGRDREAAIESLERIYGTDSMPSRYPKEVTQIEVDTSPLDIFYRSFNYTRQDDLGERLVNLRDKITCLQP